MIRKMSHATIYVLNQEEALAFYTGKLGFEVRSDFTMENGFRWLTVGPREQPDLEFILMPVIEGGVLDDDVVAHLRAVLEKGALGAGVLETDDCQATYEELKEKGVEALFKDNSGNWFSLTQQRQG